MLLISEFQFFDPKAEYTVTAGILPHWQQAGATYFITYRTFDSISKDAMARILASRDDWLRRQGIDPALPGWHHELAKKPDRLRHAFRRQLATEFESDLDKLHGECLLKRPVPAAIIADSLHHFEGQRYRLGGFVIMPNHVHILVCVFPEWEMLAQCYSWKHFQANEIHRLIGRQGNLFQKESFDHLVRDGEHFMKFRRYIKANPEKSRLREGEFVLYLPDVRCG